MAQLTQLESKLAEVMGLAQAAQKATARVGKLVEDQEVAETLERMGQEAAETEQRCARVADQLDGKKTAVSKKAKETRSEAEQMMKTYLSKDADALDGLEFLIMAEAAELGHVDIVQTLNKTAKNAQVRELIKWVQPIQKRHVQQTRQAALKLAAAEDPDEPAG